MSDIIDYLNKPPQRYDHVFQKNSGSREMVEDPKGEYVRFDDMDLYMFEGAQLMQEALAKLKRYEAALRLHHEYASSVGLSHVYLRELILASGDAALSLTSETFAKCPNCGSAYAPLARCACGKNPPQSKTKAKP